MIPLGMALVWAGYGVGLYGWILVRGYNVSFGEAFSPTSYLKKPVKDWPKLHKDFTGLLPTGQKTAGQQPSAPQSGALKPVTPKRPAKPGHGSTMD